MSSRPAKGVWIPEDLDPRFNEVRATQYPPEHQAGSCHKATRTRAASLIRWRDNVSVTDYLPQSVDFASVFQKQSCSWAVRRLYKSWTQAHTCDNIDTGLDRNIVDKRERPRADARTRALNEARAVVRYLHCFFILDKKLATIAESAVRFHGRLGRKQARLPSMKTQKW